MSVEVKNSKDCDFFIFPSNFVWWKKIENHLELKEKYLPLIKQDYELNKDVYKLKKTWDCEVTSSFFNQNLIIPFLKDDFIQSVIWNPMDEMLSHIIESVPQFPLIAPSESKIVEMWYNVYEKNNWQEIHSHSANFKGTSVFSGIYIMELNEKNGTTFCDKDAISCFSYHNIFTFVPENIEEGYVLLFPSELPHYVKPSLNNRTTISFNVTSNYADIPRNT